MIELDIDVRTANVQLFLQGLSSEGLDRASARSLNKVIVTVRKDAIQHVHRVRRLKKSAIRNSMPIVKATTRVQEARIEASRRSIPLKEYSATLRGGKGNKRVVVNVSGTRKSLDHAFIVPKLGGHVFQREGKSRLPIKKLFGPSIGSALIKGSVRQALDAVIRDRWPIVFTREANFEIDRQAKRAARTGR